MIEIAYIEYKINDYQYKVRIPKYQQLQSSPTAISTEELPTAYVCTTPGCKPLYNIGETVWVAYEQGNTSVPVIIGTLYNKTDNGSWLTLTNNVELPTQTNPNYESRFQVLEQRSIDLQSGNFSVNKISTSSTATFSISDQTIKYLPQLIFNLNQDSIQSGLKKLVNWVFNQYENESDTLYQGTIKFDQTGIVNLTINKTKINKKTEPIDTRTVPEYCTGNFQLLNKVYQFGYNNSVWYFS